MLSDDIEKNRVEHVTRIEQDNVRLKQERDFFKEQAEKHVIGIDIRQGFHEDNNSSMTVVMSYGGKVFTINVPASQVHYFKGDPDNLLRRIINVGLGQLVVDSLVENSKGDFQSIANNMNNLFERGLIQ